VGGGPALDTDLTDELEDLMDNPVKEEIAIGESANR
jgi:hypothetical protein